MSRYAYLTPRQQRIERLDELAIDLVELERSAGSLQTP
jgi:hypothetical protein